MWTFVLGLLSGLAAKAIYDLFREEQPGGGLNWSTARLEALVEETRHNVQELQQEVRQTLGSSSGTLQEKAEQIFASAKGVSSKVASESNEAADAAGGSSEDVTAPSGSAPSSPETKS